MATSVCFVCLGNICRSPTAEGVFRKLVDDAGLADVIDIDSAGTASYHTGERADPRSRACAEAHGYPLTSRARQFVRADFGRFDYIIAMDLNNRDDLITLGNGAYEVHLLRDFDESAIKGSAVPDPYYGGDDGFEKVLQICERSCTGLLQHLRETHKL